MEDCPSLKVDYLKVGHHGSKTASDYSFIKCVNPTEAIISCGKDNIYHFPHQEVIDILKSCNVKIRRTDLEGTIKYSFISI